MKKKYKSERKFKENQLYCNDINSNEEDEIFLMEIERDIEEMRYEYMYWCENIKNSYPYYVEVDWIINYDTKAEEIENWLNSEVTDWQFIENKEKSTFYFKYFDDSLKFKLYWA